MRKPIIEYTCDICFFTKPQEEIVSVKEIDICKSCCQVLERAIEMQYPIYKFITVYQETQEVSPEKLKEYEDLYWHNLVTIEVNNDTN